jgi:hypothetical protein
MEAYTDRIPALKGEAAELEGSAPRPVRADGEPRLGEVGIETGSRSIIRRPHRETLNAGAQTNDHAKSGHGSAEGVEVAFALAALTLVHFALAVRRSVVWIDPQSRHALGRTDPRPCSFASEDLGRSPSWPADPHRILIAATFLLSAILLSS